MKNPVNVVIVLKLGRVVDAVNVLKMSGNIVAVSG